MESGRKDTVIAIAPVADAWPDAVSQDMAVSLKELVRSISHKTVGVIRRRPDGEFRQMDARISQDGRVRPLDAVAIAATEYARAWHAFADQLHERARMRSTP